MLNLNEIYKLYFKFEKFIFYTNIDFQQLRQAFKRTCFCDCLVPQVTARKVQANPYNSSAIQVMWEPVQENAIGLNGVVRGYRVSFH